jgi:hypothetical protein
MRESGVTGTTTICFEFPGDVHIMTGTTLQHTSVQQIMADGSPKTGKGYVRVIEFRIFCCECAII